MRARTATDATKLRDAARTDAWERINETFQRCIVEAEREDPEFALRLAQIKLEVNRAMKEKPRL